jgi:hypothetical protein
MRVEKIKQKFENKNKRVWSYRRHGITLWTINMTLFNKTVVKYRGNGNAR